MSNIMGIRRGEALNSEAEIKFTFAEWLKWEFRLRRITPGEFSRRSGINDGTISRHLNGTTPTPRTIKKYGKALKVPEEELHKIIGYYDPGDEPIRRRNKLMELYTELSREHKLKLFEVINDMLASQGVNNE